jgi:Tfp pilus assembly protein PilN
MYLIDFLPEHVRQKRRRRARLIRQVNLLVVCAAGLAVLGAVRQRSVRHADAGLIELRQANARAARQLQQRMDLEREWASLLQKRQIDRRLGSSLTVRDVLAELSHRLPESMSLTELKVRAVQAGGSRRRSGASGSLRRAGGTGQPGRRLRLEVAGLSPTSEAIANFLGRLGSSPLFEDVNLEFTQDTLFRGKDAREFRATCLVGQ